MNKVLGLMAVLAAVPLFGAPTVSVVQDVPGYNSWPMTQAIGKRIVCAYSRGSAHTIDEPVRGVFAKVSDDGGLTWSAETTVANDSRVGEVTEGIGLADARTALMWVRCWGAPKDRHHDVYRTTDGVTFEKLAELRLDPFPMQVMDPVVLPTVGLVSPWFAGDYRKTESGHSWGLLVSADGGKTWTQRVVEGDLPKAEWPTELCAAYLGDGRVLIVARSEGGAGCQFQITSTDYGRTWKKSKTNITDVLESTPSLVYDPETGLVSNYYYQRGARQLKRRIARADFIFDRPFDWPKPEVLFTGKEQRAYDAGNVKATPVGDRHCAAIYTGTATDTSVLMIGVERPRAAAGEGLVLRKDATEVLVDPAAPKATLIAADELSGLLGKVFGGTVPVVRAPTAGKTAIVLGTNAWSRAAGLDPSKLPRDAFQIRAKGGRLYIAGCDSAYADPEAHNFLGDECLWQPQFERGTLFGVYEFLERFAGARFYFPGELGTILPRRDAVAVDGADVTSSPDFTVRRWGYADGPVPDEVLEGLSPVDFKRRFFYRLRGETEYKPCCHGQNKLFLSQRFGEEHPEYMRVDKEGRRSGIAPKWDDRPPIDVGHLCLSSGVWDEIYKDVKSYFSGEDASVRGVHAPNGETGYAWGRNCSGRKFMDVMPQDCYARCYCETCTAAYAGRTDANYASELIWGKTAELGRRLKADGFTGRLAMMAYHPYGRVPDIELPDNIDVMVACSGPWTFRAKGVLGPQVEKIRSWTEKLGHKVWIWNYVDKVACVGTAIPDAPSVSPRVMGAFYRHVKDLVFGAFAESESDRWLYHYLNYYVFAKVAWDNATDVEALLDEHHRLMFGAGAAEMKAFFEQLEDCWVDGVAGNAHETPLGPKLVSPSPAALWTQIYGPETMARLDGWLKSAAAKVPSGSLEARRIALFRRHYYEPLVKWPRQFAEETSVAAEQARRRARTPDSILTNGDFSSLEGWTGEMPQFGGISLSDRTYVSPPSSLLIEAKNAPTKENDWLRLFATQYPAAMKRPLKPDTRYRVSFFAKCEGLSSISRGGGLYVQWWDADWNWVPRKGMPVSGTTDWLHFAYEFKTPKVFKDTREHFVQFMVTGCLGKVYVDDVLLEELP